MNTDLPQIKKEGVFFRIKNWFKKLFGMEEIIEESVQTINNDVQEIKKNNFKDSIQVESKDKLLYLQAELKANNIDISDLTDEELEDMIELYKMQIEEKKNKLKKYKNKIE